jgi:hypothetical protein
MRTTVDLPEDLHQTAKDIAHDKRWTLSQAVAWLMRRGLSQEGGSKLEVGVDELTGFPLFKSGRVITYEDVKRLEDED